VRVLATEGIRALLHAAPSQWWRTVISLAVCMGLRRGELLALRWKDVDVEKGILRVVDTPEDRTKSCTNRKLWGEVRSMRRAQDRLPYDRAVGDVSDTYHEPEDDVDGGKTGKA